MSILFFVSSFIFLVSLITGFVIVPKMHRNAIQHGGGKSIGYINTIATIVAIISLIVVWFCVEITISYHEF